VSRHVLEAREKPQLLSYLYEVHPSLLKQYYAAVIDNIIAKINKVRYSEVFTLEIIHNIFI